MTTPTNPSSDPVDAELDEIFEWLLALYIDTSNPYMVEEMEDDRPLFKAKINRLLVEARIQQLDELIDIESKQFMRWSQKDIAHFFERVGAMYRNLSNQLNEEV